MSLNCWDLLRFARLSDMPRRIWVDAVCINQGNIEERGQQVAKMGQIYRESSRVVVYLGADVVVKPKHRFPRRRRLDEFASGEVRPMDSNGSTMNLDIEKLFKRRYFTRLWIIQELITSPKTVIRIGDTDFLVDTFITGKIEETSGLLHGKPLEQIPALINRQKTTNQELEANYSLSNQHLWIRFFAHCLLRLEIFWFLEYAAGPHRSPAGLRISNTTVLITLSENKSDITLKDFNF
ncbi:hypothetical protein RRF57_013314 [Xylaria bambusicola]|uniref:Heterokaryon incompatibility domain-containing protein n=1 Tax=Xylaria bambusicola TaxID=326684 RepID=A0AAN7UZ65_9PEZI